MDGIVFTKSQALQLFYQTGDVPDPVLSGDAVNKAYFDANAGGGGAGFNGSYTGETYFIGDMRITGDLYLTGGLSISGEAYNLAEFLVSADLSGYAQSGDIPETHPWEPNGFEFSRGSGHVNTDISYSGDQFTISPTGTSFNYYVSGEMFSSTGETITINTGEGSHWIYYDASGDLQVTAGAFDDAETYIQKLCIVSLYYWDADAGEAIFQGDERHGAQMDGATHRYLHNTLGCRYVDGLAISGYTLDDDTDDSVKFGISSGTIADEDIIADIEELSDGTAFPVFYRYGEDNKWRRSKTVWPYLPPGITHYAAGTFPAWNDENGGDWTLTEVSSGNFFCLWLFATTAILNTESIFGVVSQQELNTLGNARDEQFGDLNLTGLPFAEVKILYKIVFRAAHGYSNSHKVVIEEVDDYRAQDFEGVAYTPLSHTSLADRSAANQHPDSAISTSGHDNLLNGATTVEEALDLVDDLPLNDSYDGNLNGVTTLEGAMNILDDLALSLTKRIVGWFMDGADTTGDILAYQPIAYGDGPYKLMSARVDYRTVTTGEATWDIQYCTSGDFATTPSWTSIFTTKPTVDSGEISSDIGATPLAFISANVPENARMRVLCDTPGGGTGATISLVMRPVGAASPETRQFRWYMNGEEESGDLLAYQPAFFGDGPYTTVSCLIDYRTPPSGESAWDIEYCTSGDYLTSPVWTSLFSTQPTVDAGEYSSQSAATPYVFSGDIPEGARLRVRCVTPTSGEDVTVGITFSGTV